MTGVQQAVWQHVLSVAAAALFSCLGLSTSVPLL
jgi:hypothetical protein